MSGTQYKLLQEDHNLKVFGVSPLGDEFFAGEVHAVNAVDPKLELAVPVCFSDIKQIIEEVAKRKPRMKKPKPFRSLLITISCLAGDTTVLEELLYEDATLVQMIQDGKPYQELLVYVNENF